MSTVQCGSLRDVNLAQLFAAYIIREWGASGNPILVNIENGELRISSQQSMIIVEQTMDHTNRRYNLTLRYLQDNARGHTLSRMPTPVSIDIGEGYYQFPRSYAEAVHWNLYVDDYFWQDDHGRINSSPRHLPHDYSSAIEADRINGDNRWTDAMNEEMERLEVLPSFHYHNESATYDNPAEVLSRHWDMPTLRAISRPFMFWDGDVDNMSYEYETDGTMPETPD